MVDEFNSNDKKEFISISVVTILALVVGVLGPSIIGYSLGGFDSASIINQFQTYSPYLIAGAIISFLAVLIEILIKKGDNRYGNTVFFNSPGESPSFSFFSNYSNFQLAYISVLFFAGVGLLLPLVGQTSFTGVGALGQQFTEAAGILYSAVLIPISENLGVGAMAIALVVLLRYLARKNDWSEGTFNSFAILTTVVTWVGLGIANHLLRYSNNQMSILIVAGFWLFCGIITVMTGSFIPAWIFHIMNNLFYALDKIFSSDVAVITFIILFAILFIGYIYKYRENKAWLRGVKYGQG